MNAIDSGPHPHPQQPADTSLFEHDALALAKRNPGRVWLWVAALATVLLVGISAWRQGWFTPTVNLYVELPGASGMQVGTPVKLKGFKIGEVAELKLEQNLNVRLRLRILLERLPLLAVDASASFGRDGPIGGKFIDIDPGDLGPLQLPAEATLPMETGNDLDDVMATVKVAVEKLAIAIGKVEPILDDTKKLTGEASAVSTDVRTSLSTMMKNLEVISGQLKRVGDTATHLTANADRDRANLVADLRKALAVATQATEAANATMRRVEQELPSLLGKAQQSASDVNQITKDARQLSGEAAVQLPPALRAGRQVAQDAANLSEGAKRTWPISSMVGPQPSGQLPLDGAEGERP